MKQRMLLAILMIGFMSFLQARHSIEKDANGSIQVRLHLSSLVDGGGSNFVTEFLFRVAYLAMPLEIRENSFLALSDKEGGVCELKGSEEDLMQFFWAFCLEADRILEGGVFEERFALIKKEYLAELKNQGALIQADYLEQITCEEVNHYKGSFHPMLCSMSQLFSETGRLCDWKDFIDQRLEPFSFRRTELHDATLETMLVNHSCDPQDHLYEQLRLTPSDCRNIEQLIEYLSMPWHKLWRNAGRVNRLGDEVSPVHPLRFIGYILSQPKLKKKLVKNIKGSSLVWGQFVKGFGERMAKEKSQGTLYQYVPGFCRHLGIPEHFVYQYINSHNWERLVKDLMRK